ncbi:MAG: TDP-N-acetylfucosamine:lipid II N-acetylfucosaminyltransferase [Bacteroidales bacterium]|nr:TDP-N-acetylfucosamine:lipid II N-acetylfucosaminyltransferase [Bacteroidales bacterium]
MFIHIMTSENYYHISFIKFIERNFSTKQHHFVFRSKNTKRSNYKETTSIKEKPNFISLILFIPQLFRAKRIYIHYLPYGISLPFWVIFSLLSKKLVWIFWGGDIYIYNEKNNNLKTRFYELCRKIIIRRLGNIAGFLTEDFNLIKKIYKTDAAYTKTIYPLPINFTELSQGENVSKGKTIKILAGNSADPSNNHFELLHILERFKDEDIQVICPLSYGRDAAYSLRVNDEGFRVLGEKFKPLLHLLPPTEYSKILQEVDIAIMNHQRQQGLGNLISILWLGKKVFVRSDTTTFSYFKSEGIAVWDTLDIKNQSFESFILMNPNDAIKNKTLVLNVFSEHHYIELWSNVFSVK